MEITNAKYSQFNGKNISVDCVINGKPLSVPIIKSNRHYEEIMRQVDAGTLTIAEAESEAE